MGEVTPIKQARRQVSYDKAETHIEKLLGEARLKLIQTGNRSRLIHTPRGGKRSRALAINGNGCDPIFANLVQEKKTLRFIACEEISDIRGEAERLKTPRLIMPKPNCRNGLQTTLSPELLQRRLHTIHRDAKTAEEERGINILFLALGFLRWYEDDRSDVPYWLRVFLCQQFARVD